MNKKFKCHCVHIFKYYLIKLTGSYLVFSLDPKPQARIDKVDLDTVLYKEFKHDKFTNTIYKYTIKQANK